jgi:exosortase C (VPDSG-CTERM-specific)
MEAKAVMWKFQLVVGALVLLFAVSLWRLLNFAWHDELHSYIVLIPVIGIYLIRLQGKNLPAPSSPARIPAAVFSLAGLAMFAWHWLAPRPALADNLAQSSLAFLLLLAAVGFWFLGAALMRAVAFPFALLIFMVPLPDTWRDAVEVFLQHGSALVAGAMFAVSDVPVLQTGLQFKLPGITLQVAPECSGIHSTMVLFITSLVAGKLFLKRPWSRAALCLVVIPLALLRNGFRIFVLGELCVHIGPHMIESPIHHRGGPLFFALSLLPFFLLLYWLRRRERAGEASAKN